MHAATLSLYIRSKLLPSKVAPPRPPRPQGARGEEFHFVPSYLCLLYAHPERVRRTAFDTARERHGGGRIQSTCAYLDLCRGRPRGPRRRGCPGAGQLRAGAVCGVLGDAGRLARRPHRVPLVSFLGKRVYACPHSKPNFLKSEHQLLIFLPRDGGGHGGAARDPGHSGFPCGAACSPQDKRSIIGKPNF